MQKRKKHGYAECLKYMQMIKEGTSIETEGADAAKKAYINMVFFIDKDCNVTYNSYKKDDNFILK